MERESQNERVKRVCSKSEDSGSQVGVAAGNGVEHVGQLHGASRQ